MADGVGKLLETDTFKMLRSPDINFNFSKVTGYMQTWGKTPEDDPFFSPYGPLHLDMEISDGDTCPQSCSFCSPAGTKINTVHGEVNIEDIREGDIVIGMDVNDKSITLQKVEELYHREYTGDLVCIELDNGNILKLTPEHEVFTENKGWIPVKELEMSDTVVFLTKRKIENITTEHFSGDVYNFHCLPNENYFSYNMLVHNCYKANTGKKAGNYRNMSLETFKKLYVKFPKTICQIAFGITSLDANPDMFPIYDFCRENGVIPNMTISSGDNPSDEVLDKITNTCGAIAISIYANQDKDARYNLLRRMIAAVERNNTRENKMAINIHFVVHKSSLKTAYEVCSDLVTDPTLKGVNAIVFLGLKPKERGQAFEVTKNDEFTKLVNFCFASGLRFGFDSCSAPGFEKAVQESKTLTDEQKKQYTQMSEKCESGKFSAYFNVVGEYSHCSFGEDMEKGWGISLLDDNIDFMRDIWVSKQINAFRDELKANDGQCPLFPEIRIENRN